MPSQYCWITTKDRKGKKTKWKTFEKIAKKDMSTRKMFGYGSKMTQSQLEVGSTNSEKTCSLLYELLTIESSTRFQHGTAISLVGKKN